MAIKLTTYGAARGLESRLTVRVTRSGLPDLGERPDHALALPNDCSPATASNTHGYAVVLVSESSKAAGYIDRVPVVSLSSLDDFKEGHIITIDPESGFVRTVYRPESPHNTLFMTDRCNSNCLMCSQPPKDVDDSYLVSENLRIISLIRDHPLAIGITGGEPTLLGDDLVEVLRALKNKLPTTHVHLLTNGRLYRHPSFVREPLNNAFFGGLSVIGERAVPITGGNYACAN